MTFGNRRRIVVTIVSAAALAAVFLTGAPAFADPAEDAYQRAIQALAHNELDTALTEINEAIRLDPRQARFRGQRGAVWIRKNEWAKGEEDLKAAIAMNPGDAGVDYPVSPCASLSEKAIQHGRQQVEAMLRDRPAMNQYGDEADFLRQWAARRFAGEGIGSLVKWDPSPPLHSDAEHLAPAGDELGAILVERFYSSGPNRGAERSFEEHWAGAVFELHNIHYAGEFVRLHDEAAEGKVSKAAFVADILQYELRAAQQTRAFYVRIFLPWAEKKKLSSDPSLWFADWWPDPNRLLHQFGNKSTYPWRPYGRQYDWAKVQFRWRQGRFGSTIRLLRQMREEPGYETESAEVQLWIGRCLLRLGKPAQAVEALTEALRLAPEDTEALHLRGHAYEKLGETQKAEADLAKAKELEAREQRRE